MERQKSLIKLHWLQIRRAIQLFICLLFFIGLASTHSARADAAAFGVATDSVNRVLPGVVVRAGGVDVAPAVSDSNGFFLMSLRVWAGANRQPGRDLTRSSVKGYAWGVWTVKKIPLKTFT